MVENTSIPQLDELFGDCSKSVPLTHEVNRKALSYWHERRGAREMPSRTDIDPSAIREILPHVFLVDVHEEARDFRYRLIGTYLEDHWVSRYTGLWLSEIPEQRAPSMIFSALTKAVERRRPSCFNLPYRGRKSIYSQSEDIMLPLSDDGETVNMILACSVFSIGEAAETERLTRVNSG